MAYIGKLYKLQKSEKFDEFLIHLGIPADKVECMINDDLTEKIDKDGDDYVLTTFDIESTVTKFQDGVEFDEEITEDITAKTTFTVSDDTITQVQKHEDGRVFTRKRIFNGDELVIEISVSTWDGVARRYFSAA